MIRRPPRSTLFPTRRSSDLAKSHRANDRCRTLTGGNGANREKAYDRPRRSAFAFMVAPSSEWRSSFRHRWGYRSEEHTSELQSRLHLVCRLLLEKKKQLTYL